MLILILSIIHVPPVDEILTAISLHLTYIGTLKVNWKRSISVVLTFPVSGSVPNGLVPSVFATLSIFAAASVMIASCCTSQSILIFTDISDPRLLYHTISTKSNTFANPGAFQSNLFVSISYWISSHKSWNPVSISYTCPDVADPINK